MRLPPFFKHMPKGFPGFAKGLAVFSIHVVRVHFKFNGFPDESVHVSGFLQEEVLYSVVY
jgi:hypothetical protein